MENRVKPKDIPLIKKKLIAMQGGICPMCNQDLTRVSSANVVVDHDHDTGYIRAAIHRGCNGAEGKIKNLAQRFGKTKDFKEFLARLLKFWQYYATPRTEWIHPTHKTAEEKRASRNTAARKRYAAKKQEK